MVYLPSDQGKESRTDHNVAATAPARPAARVRCLSRYEQEVLRFVSRTTSSLSLGLR
jgi:hypothetical protein